MEEAVEERTLKGEALTKSRVGSPILCFPRREPLGNKVFEAYWRFAAKRQAIFFRRIANERAPWTDDEILLAFRFTNAYRASDRVSQYLIRNVIYTGEHSLEDQVFRILLFKLFNKIETWQLLESKVGPIQYSTYRFESYDRVLTDALTAGKRIYSSAYIMPSGGGLYARKHWAHLRLLEKMMVEELPKTLANCKSMEEAFRVLRGYPMIGDFLAYQYVTDLNYSEATNFTETEFVVPGPGARSGIRKCFPDLNGWAEEDVIRWVADNQDGSRVSIQNPVRLRVLGGAKSLDETLCPLGQPEK